MNTTAHQARDEAIDRVERHAPGEWNADALACLRALTATQRTVVADDVWQVIGQPPEPRALGATMRTAQAANIIRPTGDYQASVRPACHARPQRVWTAGKGAQMTQVVAVAMLGALRTKYAA